MHFFMLDCFAIAVESFYPYKKLSGGGDLINPAFAGTGLQVTVLIRMSVASGITDFTFNTNHIVIFVPLRSALNAAHQCAADLTSHGGLHPR